MKILHVIASMDPELGGVCKAVRIMVESLEQENLYNEVLCLDAPNASFLERDRFPVYALGPAQGAWGYSKNLRPWLDKNMGNYGIIVIHGLWLYPSYAVNRSVRANARDSKGMLPKIYVMPHGMLDPYFQEASGRKIKAIRNWIYWKLIECKVVNNADALLFTCEEERLLARRPFRPYHPKKEEVVGLGVSAAPPYRSEMSTAFVEKCPELNGRPYLLFLSRIHPKKGVETLVNAYLELLEKFETTRGSGCTFTYPEIPALVIAGPGMEQAYGRKIRALVESNSQLKKNVHFPGMLEADAKWGGFYHCEAFVLPSRQENFGIAIVEALACSKPVLITDKVNIWREIQSCSAGLVSEVSGLGTLELLLQWCTLNSQQRAEMSGNALQCFKKLYSTKSMVTRWQNIIPETSHRGKVHVSKIPSIL